MVNFFGLNDGSICVLYELWTNLVIWSLVHGQLTSYSYVYVASKMYWCIDLYILIGGAADGGILIKTSIRAH